MIVRVTVDVVIIKYLVVVVVIKNSFIVVVIVIIIIIIIIEYGLDSLKIFTQLFPLSFIIRSFKDLFDSLIYQDLNFKSTTIAIRFVVAQTSKNFLIPSILIYLFYLN